ncbi:MAG: zinc-dependent alcohol dehydrogenase family protein [Rhodothermia bacterium]|nr:zinc-dependent alcohol dehydrogenase family protein [Rhodothermia bacterium]
MKAMLLEQIADMTVNPEPLVQVDRAIPSPEAGQILVHVSTCGVCHTELDEIEGRTPPPRLPVVLGHQVVGKVVEAGTGANRFHVGDRVGVGWIYSVCGECAHCKAGNENLCADFRATGRDADGGYTEYMVVPEDFAHPIPDVFSDAEAAPLLCAGAIGYRSLRLANLSENSRLGLTGFGASAHLVLRMIKQKYPGITVFVFARNAQEREFALHLGAVWAGDTTDQPPALLNSIIDTTPAWKPVVEALRRLAPGGRLVVNAIRKEDVDKEYLLKMKYESDLWHEKEIKSVANVARRDIAEFLELAAAVPIKPEVLEFGLEDANQALQQIRQGGIRGAKVLRVSD